MNKISPAWFFIVPLIIWILYLTQCRGKVDSTSTYITKIDTQLIISQYKGSTTPKRDTIYQPGDTIWRPGKVIPGKPPQPIFVEIVKEIPAKVDTQAIIEAYYSKVTYKDSLSIPNHKIYVNDTLYKNQIIGRGWNITSTSQTITKTTTRRPWSIYGEIGPYQSKTQFIAGGEITLGYLNRTGQGIEFSMLRTKGEWLKGIKFHQTIFQYNK